MRAASTLLLATLALTACEPTVQIYGHTCPAAATDAAIECWHKAEITAKGYETSSPATNQEPSGYITYRAGVILPDKKLNSMINPRGPVYITRPLP